MSILEKYPLKEITDFSFEESIAERTRRNIIDYDGKLIIVPNFPLSSKIKDGTLLTIEHCIATRKPYLIIEVEHDSSARLSTKIKTWLEENNIHVLNIAGPCESSCPGIFKLACILFRDCFATQIYRPRL